MANKNKHVELEMKITKHDMIDPDLFLPVISASTAVLLLACALAMTLV